jgi:phosphatidylglycerol:prolipoprotein diacylglycerol transferase
MNVALSPHIVFWLLAGVMGGGVALTLNRRDGLPLGRCALAWALSMAVTLIGSRLYYIIDNDVPTSVWSRQGPLAGGVRIPGGLLADFVVMPFVLRALGLPILRFADAATPAAALALAIGRMHCFIAGCCFGRPTDLPWAVRFGPFSPARVNHIEQGLIPPEARFSLLVHPLQIYFAVAALLLGIFLIWFRRRRVYEGEGLLAFIVVYCWAKISLETLRERTLIPDAPDPFWIGIVLGTSATALLATLRWRTPTEQGRLALPPGADADVRSGERVTRVTTP